MDMIEKVINLFNDNHRDLTVYDIQAFLEYKLSILEIKELIDKLISEKILRKGNDRSSFRNTERFNCVCYVCKEQFKSHNSTSNLCHHCHRAELVPIEQEVIPHLKLMKMECKLLEKEIMRKKEIINKKRADKR